MITIYNIQQKCTRAMEQAEPLTHAFVYSKELGVKSGDIIDIQLLDTMGETMGRIPARLSAAWKLPWAIFQDCEWIHEMDCGLRQPESKAFYLRWWGNMDPTQEILILLLTPIRVPAELAAPQPA